MRSRVTVTPFYSLWWIESNCVVHWVEKGEDLRLHTLPPTRVITSRRYQVYSETHTSKKFSAEVVCGVGDNQHGLAHRCLLCKQIFAHMMGHSRVLKSTGQTFRSQARV